MSEPVEIWRPTARQARVMREHPEIVLQRVLEGGEPTPAQLRLVREMGRALEDAPEGSALGMHVSAGRIHLYPVPPAGKERDA